MPVALDLSLPSCDFDFERRADGAGAGGFRTAERRAGGVVHAYRRRESVRCPDDGVHTGAWLAAVVLDACGLALRKARSHKTQDARFVLTRSTDWSQTRNYFCTCVHVIYSFPESSESSVTRTYSQT